MSKIFYVDLQKCTGCHSCQIGCKDEHCGNSWLPYAAEQPEIGQFWCRVDEKERGAGSHVRVSYVPKLGAQTDAIRDYAPEVLMEREDGLIVIDPEKAKGRKDLADKFDGVYWNEELQIPQGCTGCAHLLDDPDWPIRIPRCVDNCPVGALQFGDRARVRPERSAEVLEEGSRVYYQGTAQDLHRRHRGSTPMRWRWWRAPRSRRKASKARSRPRPTSGATFWLKEIPAAEYTVIIEKDGKSEQLEVSTLEKDQGLPDIALA